MFAFSQIEPRTSGQVKPEIPMSRFLGAAWDQGVHDSMAASIYRASEQFQIDHDLSLWGTLDQQQGRLLSADEANQAYGTPRLRFTESEYEGVAQLKRERHDENERRAFILSAGTTGPVRWGLSFGTSMVASMLNPVDFTTMFVPIVGSEATASKLATMGIGGARRALARGLVTEERLRKLVPAPRLVATAIEGTVGQAIAEVPLYVSNRMDQTPYGLEDSAINVLAGGAFAVGLRYGLRGAGHLMLKLTPETRRAGAIKAMADFLMGRDTDVRDLVEVDENLIREKVKFDEIKARAEAREFVESKGQEAALKSWAEAQLSVEGSLGRVDQPNLMRIARDWIPIWEAQGKDVTMVKRLFEEAEKGEWGGVSEPIALQNLAALFNLEYDPMAREYPQVYHLADDPARAKLRKAAGVDAFNVASERWGTISNAERRKQAAYLAAQRSEKIEKLTRAERDRRIKALVEKMRNEYNPEQATRQRVNAEIEEQVKQGKLLTAEQIDRYRQEAKLTEQDVAALEEHVKELQQEFKDVEPSEKVQEDPTFVQHLVDTLEKLKMETSDEKELSSGVPRETWNAFIDLLIDALHAGERFMQSVEKSIKDLGVTDKMGEKIKRRLFSKTADLSSAAMMPIEELKAERTGMLAAAVSTYDGEVLRGLAHAFAWEKLDKRTLRNVADDVVRTISDLDVTDYTTHFGDDSEGFITKLQRFVGREEARILTNIGEAYRNLHLVEQLDPTLIDQVVSIYEGDLRSPTDTSTSNWIHTLNLTLDEFRAKLSTDVAFLKEALSHVVDSLQPWVQKSEVMEDFKTRISDEELREWHKRAVARTLQDGFDPVLADNVDAYGLVVPEKYALSGRFYVNKDRLESDTFRQFNAYPNMTPEGLARLKARRRVQKSGYKEIDRITNETWEPWIETKKPWRTGLDIRTTDSRSAFIDAIEVETGRARRGEPEQYTDTEAFPLFMSFENPDEVRSAFLFPGLSPQPYVLVDGVSGIAWRFTHQWELAQFWWHRFGRSMYLGDLRSMRPAERAEYLEDFPAGQGSIFDFIEDKRPTAPIDTHLIDSAVKFFENRKIDTNGLMFDASIGIPIAVWNSSLDLVIGALRAGKLIAEAIAEGYAHVRTILGENAPSEDLYARSIFGQYTGTAGPVETHIAGRSEFLPGIQRPPVIHDQGPLHFDQALAGAAFMEELHRQLFGGKSVLGPIAGWTPFDNAAQPDFNTEEAAKALLNYGAAFDRWRAAQAFMGPVFHRGIGGQFDPTRARTLPGRASGIGGWYLGDAIYAGDPVIASSFLVIGAGGAENPTGEILSVALKPQAKVFDLTLDEPRRFLSMKQRLQIARTMQEGLDVSIREWFSESVQQLGQGFFFEPIAERAQAALNDVISKYDVGDMTELEFMSAVVKHFETAPLHDILPPSILNNLLTYRRLISSLISNGEESLLNVALVLDEMLHPLDSGDLFPVNSSWVITQSLGKAMKDLGFDAILHPSDDVGHLEQRVPWLAGDEQLRAIAIFNPEQVDVVGRDIYKPVSSMSAEVDFKLVRQMRDCII